MRSLLVLLVAKFARAHIGGDASRDRVYVGVLPDPGPYRDLIVLPDRREGHEIADSIEVIGGLILASEGLGSEALDELWRQVTIQVQVDHPEFKPLTFHHRLSQPMPGPVRLQVRE